MAVETLRFPRLQKRGPIEAGVSPERHSAWPPRFHAYKSVAPLKLQAAKPSMQRVKAGFHAYKSVAPLKLGGLALLPAVTLAFPRLQKRGPIEASRMASMSSSNSAVSTLTKAWPH